MGSFGLKIVFLFALTLALPLCAADLSQKSPCARKVRRTTSGEVYVRVAVKKQKKETCNPTSMSIILNYFDVFVSPRALQKASAGGDDYKRSSYLKAQVARYGMEMIPFRGRAERQSVFAAVRRAVDCGLPLQWLVDLKKAPRYDINEYQQAQLASGVSGHARVLHGYLLDRRTRALRGFIFTDPWGLRRREILADDMLNMTLGFFLVVPKNFDPAVVRYVLAPLDPKKR